MHEQVPFIKKNLSLNRKFPLKLFFLYTLCFSLKKIRFTSPSFYLPVENAVFMFNKIVAFLQIAYVKTGL